MAEIRELTRELGRLRRELDGIRGSAMRASARNYQGYLTKARILVAQIFDKLGDNMDNFNIVRGSLSYINALRGIAEGVRELSAENDAVITKAARIAYEKGYYRAVYALEKGANVRIYTGRVQQDVIDRVVNNKYKRLSLFNTTKLTENKLRKALESGLRENRTYKQISASLKKQYTGSLYAWERTVRTECHRAASMANNQAYREAADSGVNLRYRINSAIDNRTRPQSAEMDGQYGNDKGEFLYPDPVNAWAIPGNTGHPGFDINDRETVVTELDGYSPEARREQLDGELQYRTFADYAKTKKLKKNVYGQKYNF